MSASDDEMQCEECDVPPACSDSPMIVGGIGCCLALAVLLAVTSIGAVPPLFYGIRYNYASKWAEIERVYTPGRYFLGPWNTFVLFPATVQNIEFVNEPRISPSGERYSALHTRTKEGLALDLEVSLQYRLKEADVGKLYVEFNVNYTSMFVSTIRDTLIAAAAEHHAGEFWTQRKLVGERMQSMVNDILGVTYSEVWGLQLMDIALPDQFDKSIVATEIQRQSIATMEFHQRSTQIRATTRVIAAEFARQVKTISAGAQANYTLLTKVAKARARQNVYLTEAQVLGEVRGRLKLQGPDLVEYQHCNIIKQLDNASLYYGFGMGSQVLLQAPSGAVSPAQQRRLDVRNPAELEVYPAGSQPFTSSHDEL